MLRGGGPPRWLQRRGGLTLGFVDEAGGETGIEARPSEERAPSLQPFPGCSLANDPAMAHALPPATACNVGRVLAGDIAGGAPTRTSRL